ncbi:hypothetical protein, partial [Streptomyces cahuitamycinicus]
MAGTGVIPHALGWLHALPNPGTCWCAWATGPPANAAADGAIILAAAGSYDDQDWVVTQHSSGAWTIRNART